MSEYMSYEEVMKILGVGRSTLWLWLKTKDNFPKPFRAGRKLRWKRSEIEAYLETTRQL